MDKKEEIFKLIENLKKEYKIPGYLHTDYFNFIPGETPVYYSGPYFDGEEIYASVDSLLTGAWMTSGKKVQEFENKFSEIIKTKHSTMVNSGSSANLVMIGALKKYFNWADQDEIIVSVVGFPTTISVIVQNNLNPVFIDIELDTLNFNLDLIQEKISDRTRAIFLSPVLGNPPDMDKLIKIAEKNNLHIILDNCDSLMSEWDGKYLNEYAVASSCSFYAAHNICTFEGGMVSSNIKELNHIVHSLINWGRDCICSGEENLIRNGVCNDRFAKWIPEYNGIIDHKYVFSNIGYNLKPLDFQGAVGIEQLKKISTISIRRKEHKRLIEKFLVNNIPEIYVPKELNKADTVWFGCPIVCKNKEQKQHLVNYLESNKIQTRNYFAGNILIHPGFKKLGDYKKYPKANTVLDNVFFIGVSPSYNGDVLHYIEEVLKDYKYV